MLDTRSTTTPVTPTCLLISPQEASPILAQTLSEVGSVQYCATTQEALQFLTTKTPILVCLSSRYALTKQLQILEATKQKSHARLIPILLWLDTTQPTVVIPGTRWAGKIAYHSSNSNALELRSSLYRLLQ